MDSPCPCGSSLSYDNYCAPYHGGAIAASAEALMRSRYCAYVLALEPYLLATWHSSTRPRSLDLAANDQTRWLGLEVRRHESCPGPGGNAIVEFVARYKIAGRAFRLHETSRFLHQDGRWFYLDGECA